MLDTVSSRLGMAQRVGIQVREAAWFATRCSLGKRGLHGGLYSPPDIAQASAKYGANCGPAALSALAARPVCEVMRWFPKYPAQNWTTKGDMKQAAIEAGWEVEAIGSRLPEQGCLLIELLPVNEARYVHPIARLKRSHWIGCRQGLVYDVNWEGWLPLSLWERLVLPSIRMPEGSVRSWRPLDGLEFRTKGTLASGQAPPPSGICDRGANSGRVVIGV